MRSNITTIRSLESASPAIDPIRVEMFSTEMPVHQLAKRGDEAIRIIRRDRKGGQISLYWKVEPNPAVGHPGQLAYHLDTWVINRILDRMPRPIPRLIRVGDLRDVARQVNHGGDTNAVKRAFEQNASAFIRAKLAYRTREGREDSFEGYFNRYNVIYRGQTLPGGKRAETVYISLNDPYHGIINAPTRRPLDYQYLRTLAPGAQRLYELLSPRIFAAIKNGYSSAWIRYSDFCSLAVARRQETRQRIQSQMAAIQRPHLASGYFSSVSWRAERGTDGTSDWTIHYVPGPRARAEYDVFNRDRSQPHGLPTGNSRVVRMGTGVLRPQPKPIAAISEDSPPTALARHFAERRHGLSAPRITPSEVSKATEILSMFEGDLASAIVAIDLAAEHGKRDRKEFPSHLGGVLKGGFVERARAIETENRRRAKAERLHHQEAVDSRRCEAWCRSRADARIAKLDPADRRRLVDERLPRFVEEYRYFIRQLELRGESVSAWAEPRILKRYGHEGEPSFEEWRRLHDGQPTNSSGPDEALQ